MESTGYTFRPATKEDFAIICTFPQNALELFYMYPSGVFPLTAEQLERAASTRWKPTVVVDDSGQLAGYANFYGLDPEKHCWLGNFIVHTEYRGKGAASALIGEMVRIAGVELGVPKLLLGCHNTNLTGLLFYKKLGFKPFDMNVMKNHLGETVVGIQMGLAT